MKRKVISYMRCSTVGQSEKHSIPAQRASVAAHLQGGELLAEYIDVLSGTRCDRPQLQLALQHAKAANATLICSKLDRIGRKASHVLTLLDESGVEVIFADNPNANKLTLGVLAVVAEEEARAISTRTKAGLAAARAKGKRLGNPNGARALRRYEQAHGNTAGVEGAKAAADEFAEGLRFAVEHALEEGAGSVSAIAEALNSAGFETRRGGRWYPASAKRLLDRLGVEFAA